MRSATSTTGDDTGTVSDDELPLLMLRALKAMVERLNEDEQRYEYKSNHAHLTSLLGEPPAVVSHPCNSYNQTTLRILRSLGVKVGFRANMAIGFSSELELPREDHANLVRRVAA